MNKKSRWAAIIGVVCGAELVAAIVIGGAGLAALVSVEAAFVAVLLCSVTFWVVFERRRRDVGGDAANGDDLQPEAQTLGSSA